MISWSRIKKEAARTLEADRTSGVCLDEDEVRDLKHLLQSERPLDWTELGFVSQVALVLYGFANQTASGAFIATPFGREFAKAKGIIQG